MSKPDLNETLNKVTELSQDILGTFKQVACPIINDICSELNQPKPFNDSDLNKKTPHSEIKETENEIKIILLLAGVEKQNINIKLNNNTLIIKATSNFKDDSFQNFKEIEYSREFKIKHRITKQDLNVKYHHGLLKIIIKKNDIQPYDDNINIE